MGNSKEPSLKARIAILETHNKWIRDSLDNMHGDMSKLHEKLDRVIFAVVIFGVISILAAVLN